MQYSELREYMRRYHLGQITQLEMIAAIALWQRGGARLYAPGVGPAGLVR